MKNYLGVIRACVISNVKKKKSFIEERRNMGRGKGDKEEYDSIFIIAFNTLKIMHK